MSSKEYRDNFRAVTLKMLRECYGDDEVWAFHPEYEHLLVSTAGKVKNAVTDYVYAQRAKKADYLEVSIPLGNHKSRSEYVHRLVAETFFPFVNSSDFEVNHIVADKSNVTVQNLEWVTRRENIDHAVINGLYKKKPHWKKYSSELVSEIQELRNLGFSCKELSKAYDIKLPNIYYILYKEDKCPS